MPTEEHGGAAVSCQWSIYARGKLPVANQDD